MGVLIRGQRGIGAETMGVGGVLRRDGGCMRKDSLIGVMLR